MTDRHINFRPYQVRAALDGRLSQTRRVLGNTGRGRGRWNIFNAEVAWSDSFVMDPGNSRWREKDNPYAPGDRLWVREAWAVSGDFAAINSFDWAKFHDPRRMFQENLRFRADADAYETAVQAWRYPIHMPRWASRLTLIVTDVQVQRLQEISEDDARAEGVLPDGFEGYRGHEGTIGYPTAIWAFRHIWNSIHGPDAWDANPWVAAISFTVHRCNIDTMEEGTW